MPATRGLLGRARRGSARRSPRRSHLLEFVRGLRKRQVLVVLHIWIDLALFITWSLGPENFRKYSSKSDRRLGGTTSLKASSRTKEAIDSDKLRPVKVFPPTAKPGVLDEISGPYKWSHEIQIRSPGPLWAQNKKNSTLCSAKIILSVQFIMLS